jgi:hypothetical protein
MRYVQWGNRIVPASLLEPTARELSQPGVCRLCGGLGSIAETIDEERYDVMVPCHMCRIFCKACNDWVKKQEHECKGK